MPQTSKSKRSNYNAISDGKLASKKRIEDRDEKILERIVLGKSDDFIAKLNKIKPIRHADPTDELPLSSESDDSDYEEKKLVTKDYRQIVLKEVPATSDSLNHEEGNQDQVETSNTQEKRVAWEDDDDDIE